MKKCIKNLILCCLAANILVLSACKKEPFGNIKTFVGTWQVVSLQTQTFDATGKMTADETKTDIGDAEIKADESEKGNFNPIIFDPKMGAFKPIATVTANGAGSSATNGRYSVYFSPDIDNNRINFWAVGPGATYSDIATVTKCTATELEMSAVTVFPSSANNTTTPTMQYMQKLILKKK
jgi:hypothetical protein